MTEFMWGDRPRDWGSPSQSSISSVFFERKRYRENPDEHMLFAEDRNAQVLMGFVIPPFQRGLVWTEEQKIKLIESAAQGISIGTFTYHQSENVKIKDGREYFPYDYWLIDGQQRMNALEEWFDDKFPVFGEFWSNLPLPVQRGFLNKSFPSYILKNKSFDELVEYYDMLNFGGVSHRPEERPSNVLASKGV